MSNLFFFKPSCLINVTTQDKNNYVTGVISLGFGAGVVWDEGRPLFVLCFSSLSVDGMKPKMEETLGSHCQPKWPNQVLWLPSFTTTGAEGGGQRGDKEDLNLINIWGETTTQVKHTIVCLHCIMSYKSNCKNTLVLRGALWITSVNTALRQGTCASTLGP